MIPKMQLLENRNPIKVASMVKNRKIKQGRFGKKMLKSIMIPMLAFILATIQSKAKQIWEYAAIESSFHILIDRPFAQRVNKQALGINHKTLYSMYTKNNIIVKNMEFTKIHLIQLNIDCLILYVAADEEKNHSHSDSTYISVYIDQKRRSIFKKNLKFYLTVDEHVPHIRLKKKHHIKKATFHVAISQFQS